MAIVLDSWAIIAFFQGEQPASDRVEEILLTAQKEKDPLIMTTINVGEVCCNLSRTGSDELADGAIHRIRTLDIEVIPADWDLTYRAVKFKTLGNIDYADCFAAALAIRESAVLLTGDREFKVLEDKINIYRL